MPATDPKRLVLLGALFLLLTFNCLALEPLERRVSINLYDARIETILKELETQAQVKFSYSPQQIEVTATLDAVFRSKPLRFILDQLFRGEVQYKSRGNYIILTPNSNPPKQQEAPHQHIKKISGYVIDARSGDYLSGVSIFDSISFSSTLSDESGHFYFDLEPESKALFLLIRRSGYRDTAYHIPEEAFQSVELYIQPLVPPAPVNPIPAPDTTLGKPAPDSSSGDTVRDWKNEIRQDFKEIGAFLNSKLRLNSRNINDTFFRKVQFSLVPGVSTNKMLGGSVVNNYSFNVLGGYSQGVNVLELGGLFNLDRGDVHYVQAAGLFNVVGGEVTGFQAAGLFNYTRSNVYGFQGAGLFNMNHGSMDGVQAAGLLNVNHDTTHGFQAAGLFNLGHAPAYGFQAAGLFNQNRDAVYGGQAAGLFNKAHAMDGIQVAGLFNRAHTINGVQIGLFNIADSMNGVQIGFFNYVRKGYHKWEIGADEVFYARTSFRSGTHWLHSIFSAGVDPRASAHTNWFLGYGLGTSLPIGRHYLDLDLSSSWINSGKPEFYLSTLGQVYLGMDFRLTRKFSLSCGVTANAFFYEPAHPRFAEGLSTVPRTSFHEEVEPGYWVQGWLGWKAAVRLF